MKRFILLMSVLSSLSAVASNCSTLQGVTALCEADAAKLELSKFGRMRTETFRSKVTHEASGYYPAPIVCQFSYLSDVSYRGAYMVTNMVGSVAYEPVTCAVISKFSTVSK